MGSSVSNWMFAKTESNAQSEMGYTRMDGNRLRSKCYKDKNAMACHELARFLHHVNNNVEEALELLIRNCARDHYGPSCYSLGQVILRGGRGKTQHVEQALRFYSRSCQLSCGHGCAMAAYIHAVGLDEAVPADLKVAAEFFEAGCNLNDKASCTQLGLLKLYGPKGYPENQQEALECFRKGCEFGSFLACTEVAKMYYLGIAVEKDEKQARAYFKRAKLLHDRNKMKKSM